MFDEPYEPPADVWGVGWVNGRPWAMSVADVEDETEVAIAHLQRLGVAAGDFVLVVFTLSETVHAAPLEQAAVRLGARYSSADATEADAFRVAALVRALHPKAVIGINEAVIRGIDDLDVLSTVPVVAVADDAAGESLRAAGMEPHRWVALGPTSACEPSPGSGAVFAADRWAVDVADDGEALVTNLVERHTPARRLRTGVLASRLAL